jgi:phosphoglycolate phosphatase
MNSGALNAQIEFLRETELIGHLLEHEGLDAATTVMIGDRSFDVIGASNNDVGIVGASWGYGSEGELEQAGANRICHHPDALPDLLFG